MNKWKWSHWKIWGGVLRHGLAHSPGSVTVCSRHGCSFRGVFLPSLHPRYVPCCQPTKMIVHAWFSQSASSALLWKGMLLRLFSQGTLLRLFPQSPTRFHLIQVVETHSILQLIIHLANLLFRLAQQANEKLIIHLFHYCDYWKLIIHLFKKCLLPWIRLFR